MNTKTTARVVGPGVARISSPKQGEATLTKHELRVMYEFFKDIKQVRSLMNELEAHR